MNNEDKLFHIYRLCSGYTFINLRRTYIIDTPSMVLLNEGMNVYRQTIQENKYDSLLNVEQVKVELIRAGLWSFTGDEDYKKLEASLEERKHKLYLAYLNNPNAVKKIEKEIVLTRQQLKKQYNIRHSLDEHTIEGLAALKKEQYIFSKIILDDKYRPLAKLPASLLDRILNQYYRLQLNNETARELARSDFWRSRWDHKGVDNFRVIGDEQEILISYSKLYSNVYKNSDCPSDEVINNDDLFDGWIIHTNKEYEKQKKERENEKRFDKHPNAGEVFIPVRSKDEADQVVNMNDTRGKIVQKKINELVVSKGQAHDLEVPEVLLEHKMKSKQKGSRHGK